MSDLKIKQWSYEENDLKVIDTFFEGFDMDRLKRVSFVGVNQNIEAMYQFACEAIKRKKQVVITTQVEQEYGVKMDNVHLIEIENWNQLKKSELIQGINLIGKPAKDGILTAPKGVIPDDIADIVLVQTDETKGYGVKVLREEEPSVDDASDMVVVCLGVDAVGKTFKEGCYQFETQGNWLRRDKEDVLTEEDMMLMIVDNRGYRKVLSYKDGIQYRVMLRVTNEKYCEYAKKVIQRIPAFMRDECIVFEEKNRGIN